jgi:hypothetical protein
MANFCTKCGAPLEEGQICPCQQTAQSAPTPVVTPQQPVNPIPAQATPNTFYQPPVASSNPFSGFGELIKNIFTSPADAIAKYANDEGNFLGSIIIAAIQAFSVALFSLLFVLFSAGKLSSAFGDDAAVELIKLFFITFIGSALIMAAYFGILLLLTVIFQGKPDPKKALNCISLRSIVVIPFMVLGIISAIFSSVLAFGCFIFCEFVALIFVYIGMRASSGVSENKNFWIMAIAAILLVIVFYIVVRILSNAISIEKLISMVLFSNISLY